MSSHVPVQQSSPLLLTIEEAAAFTGLGRDYAYTQVNSGAWPVVRVGKRKRMISRAFLLATYADAFRGESTESGSADHA